ncbi:unnamed protein product [Linum tenue]|uniref:Uncharacterized protein n=1 Tax=Linum tenue TaxID=586396 RepID=A0AAV0P6J2_9ROSI|nr:unnamed protein product [Linum tenue]
MSTSAMPPCWECGDSKPQEAADFSSVHPWNWPQQGSSDSGGLECPEQAYQGLDRCRT